MKVRVELTDVFSCSLERAFKAPILGDATKFLNGYLFQPPVIGFEEDETWGQINGVRYPLTNGNLWMPKGRIFTDKILERENDKHWTWMVYDFKLPLLFFAEKAIGEWRVNELAKNKIAVTYSYSYYSKNIFYHLFTLAFIYIQWKGMMKKAIKGIKQQAEKDVGFLYE